MGVVLYAVLSGVLPFDPGIAEDIENLFLGNPEFESDNPNSPLKAFDNISEECKDLISLMLCADPEERLSIADALNHPWFTRFDDQNEIPDEINEIFDIIEDADKYDKNDDF